MLPLFVQTVLAILGVLCFGYAIKRAVKQKKIDCLLFLLGGLVLVFAEYFSWIDGYWLSVIKFMGLNVIFATSLIDALQYWLTDVYPALRAHL